MELSNHGSVKKMANRITCHSCSSKGLDNQMEANDRLKQSGGDSKNMNKAQKLMIMCLQWLFIRDGSIF